MGDEQAHPGCRPASPRQHEVLMDLIDWREHQEVWAEQTKLQCVCACVWRGGGINLVSIGQLGLWRINQKVDGFKA